MPLDRNTVERRSRAHIKQLESRRGVSDAEKRRIRKLHERIAEKVDKKSRR